MSDSCQKTFGGSVDSLRHARAVDVGGARLQTSKSKDNFGLDLGREDCCSIIYLIFLNIFSFMFTLFLQYYSITSRLVQTKQQTFRYTYILLYMLKFHQLERHNVSARPEARMPIPLPS